MFVRQISVFVENKSGRLAEILSELARNQINIRASAIADTSDFGILRMIVDKPFDAERVLKEGGHTAKGTDVLAVAIPDKPGGLAEVLEVLKAEGIFLEYMYAFAGKTGDNAMVIIRVDDNKKAAEVLDKKSISILSPDVVYRL